MATGNFNKPDNRDLLTGNTFEVVDTDEESKPASSGIVHEGLSCDCAPSVELKFHRKLDNGHPELLDVDINY